MGPRGRGFGVGSAFVLRFSGFVKNSNSSRLELKIYNKGWLIGILPYTRQITNNHIERTE